LHTPENEADRLQAGEFCHLNKAVNLGQERRNWRLGPVAQDRLWVATLHYHEWAYRLAEAVAQNPNGSEADCFRELVSDWITQCDLEYPGALALAWNSYAIATRLGWWVRSYRLLGAELWRSWPEFEHRFLANMWRQAAYLHDHVEWDLRANHLLRDAVGLAWAGRFFAEAPAQRWLSDATELAVRQITEQVLPDGGHFERSPMYHLQVMEDLATLVHLLSDEEGRQALRKTWERMAEWAAWMRHSDGYFPLFNDAADNGASSPATILALSPLLDVHADAQPRRGGRHFADTGVAVWHGDPWSVFFDLGEVGPDYQPGHAHADTLSIECDYRGIRLFVDPGVYGYDDDARRRYDRSTSAHNTVCVDGCDSTEVWHIFRVGRRAYPQQVRIAFTDSGMDASACHDGFDHLPGRPRHSRRLLAQDGGELVIHDRVEGKGRHTAEAGLLLAPSWQATPEGGGWLLVNGGHRLRVGVHGPAELTLSQCPRPFHPEFGRELETTRLVWRNVGTTPMDVAVHVEAR
jgi:uncharacterized heparinase superfamily protein